MLFHTYTNQSTLCALHASMHVHTDMHKQIHTHAQMYEEFLEYGLLLYN